MSNEIISIYLENRQTLLYHVTDIILTRVYDR